MNSVIRSKFLMVYGICLFEVSFNFTNFAQRSSEAKLTRWHNLSFFGSINRLVAIDQQIALLLE